MTVSNGADFKDAEFEWIREDSPQWELIMLFNDKDKPLMYTPPNTTVDCYVYSARVFAVKSKTDPKKLDFKVGVVFKVQAAVNMGNVLAGQFVKNKLIARTVKEVVSKDANGVEHKEKVTYHKVSHMQLISLNDMNHIIDLNRPDVLDPQTIFGASKMFKSIAKYWFEQKWLPRPMFERVMDLPDGESDKIDPKIVTTVSNNAGFKRALKRWREQNWLNEEKAREYAIRGSYLYTIDDCLSVAGSVGPD